MVDLVLSDFNMSNIIAFVNVLKDVFHTFDSSAYLHIHMAIELHEMRVVWYNPRVIYCMTTQLCSVLASPSVHWVSIDT